jgi:hypothetical protein
MKATLLLLVSSPLIVLAAPAYELHEWGTFTTVAGSDGVLLSGLQREEEELPRFVHSHFGFENGQPVDGGKLTSITNTHGYPAFPSKTKGLGRRPVSGVTVKMETPVIYFHSQEPFRATVKVGFEGGTISQWYPARSGGETLPEPPPSADPINQPVPAEKWRIDFAKPYRGGIEWDVNVLSPAESRATRTFKPRDSVTWLRARVPEANVVRTGCGETENYLFYRGVGNFAPGLRTKISPDEILHLENQTGGDIPYFLVFQQNDGIVSWHARTSGLKSGESLDLAESSLTPMAAGFPAPIYESLKSGLAACGLLESEADAMVQTWWTSYFETEGLRVFWVLPAASTDRILPLSVTPPPARTVRVLVGRSEVLRPRLENGWLAASKKTGDAALPWRHTVDNDRFGLAIKERVKVLENHASASAASGN